MPRSMSFSSQLRLILRSNLESQNFFAPQCADAFVTFAIAALTSLPPKCRRAGQGSLDH